MTVEIDKNAEPFLFDGPIPGQSLTNAKENSYAWEQAPEITSHKEAMEFIFLDLLKEENLETVSSLMIEGTPITDIAQMLLTLGFQAGKWNPDLMLMLIEPTIYMLLAIAEQIGIDPVLDREDDRDIESSDDDMEILMDLEKSKLSTKEDVFQQATVNPAAVQGLNIEERLNKIDGEKIKQSILEKRNNNKSSLLSKQEEN